MHFVEVQASDIFICNFVEYGRTVRLYYYAFRSIVVFERTVWGFGVVLAAVVLCAF